jgi:hypothetical protein
MNIVPAAQLNYLDHESSTFRLAVIDLGIPRRIKSYDKLGCKNMISSFKFALFGNGSARMSKRRCESFFDDAQNFAL